MKPMRQRHEILRGKAARWWEEIDLSDRALDEEISPPYGALFFLLLVLFGLALVLVNL